MNNNVNGNGHAHDQATTPIVIDETAIWAFTDSLRDTGIQEPERFVAEVVVPIARETDTTLFHAAHKWANKNKDSDPQARLLVTVLETVRG